MEIVFFVLGAVAGIMGWHLLRPGLKARHERRLDEMAYAAVLSEGINAEHSCVNYPMTTLGSSKNTGMQVAMRCPAARRRIEAEERSSREAVEWDINPRKGS